MNWSKEIPGKRGKLGAWYWIAYKNKHDGMTVCPAQVFHHKEGVLIQSARNDTFQTGNGRPPGIYYGTDRDDSIRFGDHIPTPAPPRQRKPRKKVS